MADHMHGMFAFALWDDEKEELFCREISLVQSRFIIMRQQTESPCMGQPSIISWNNRDS